MKSPENDENRRRTPTSCDTRATPGFARRSGAAMLAAMLCINGHPSPRSSHVTYGGLSPRHGYERDHHIPLCLGGVDVQPNVRYQSYPEASYKDAEERELCEAMCAGRISKPAAIDQIIRDWGE